MKRWMKKIKNAGGIKRIKFPAMIAVFLVLFFIGYAYEDIHDPAQSYRNIASIMEENPAYYNEDSYKGTEESRNADSSSLIGSMKDTAAKSVGSDVVSVNGFWISKSTGILVVLNGNHKTVYLNTGIEDAVVLDRLTEDIYCETLLEVYEELYTLLEPV